MSSSWYNCIVEIPKGTIQKYEYDEELDIFVLDRTLPSTLPYPMSYGFIPQTVGGDADPLDVCIYASETIERETLVRFKPVTALKMIDNGFPDYKIIGIPAGNPNIDKYNDVKDLDQIVIEHTENFFLLYKKRHRNPVNVEINGWTTKEETEEIIKSAWVNYLGIKALRDKT